MGFPREIQSDRGSNFMPGHFAQALAQLGIKHSVSAPYHPESQGAVERFHGTLKTMLREYTLEYGSNWEEGLPLLLFAAMSTVQESLGYSPAELVFGHGVLDPLKILKEQWLNALPEGIDVQTRFIRMEDIWKIAKENSEVSRDTMKIKFDKNAQSWTFEKGDQVLLYLPKSGESLQAKFQGPFTVSEKVSPLNYVISTPDRRKKSRLCHVNILKAFYAPKDVFTNTHTRDDNVDNILYHPDFPLKNPKALDQLPTRLQHLNTQAQRDILGLIHHFPQLFTDIPR